MEFLRYGKSRREAISDVIDSVIAESAISKENQAYAWRLLAPASSGSTNGEIY
jgi:hypothetical protein